MNYSQLCSKILRCLKKMISELTYGTALIIKIGGSQQKNIEDVKRQASHIMNLYNSGFKVIAVLSAHYGVTKKLREESSDPWHLIKGEWEAVNLMKELLGDNCNTYRQDNGFPLVGDINDYANVTSRLDELLSSDKPDLIPGFGIIKPDGELSITPGGSDDVAALLAKDLREATLVYQKDTGCIIHPWPNGAPQSIVSSSWLLNNDIKQVLSEGTIKILIDYCINAHVCNLNNWLNGTLIVSDYASLGKRSASQCSTYPGLR